MPRPSFIAGARQALVKVASLDAEVNDAVRALAPGASADDELEDVFDGEDELEAALMGIEDEFGIKLPNVLTLMATGTIGDLKAAVADKLTFRKHASDHAYYMSHKARILQQSRQYRMRNMQALRRKSRRYRKMIKRKQIRPRRRVGTQGGGYKLIPR